MGRKRMVLKRNGKAYGLWPFLIILSFLTGCASLAEKAKGIVGVSTRALEENREYAITRSFGYDYVTCYSATLNILRHIGTYVYAQDIKKHMIAIYVSEQDTTPVGIFFKEDNPANTKIEVSSPSVYAKEFISKNIFSVLDKTITLEELEVEINAKKEI